MGHGHGIRVLPCSTPDTIWQPAIDSAAVCEATILGYGSEADAAAAILVQRAKCGLSLDSRPEPLPAGLWGVWLPSRGSEAESVGQWLEPTDDDGVPSALLFESREAAQRTLELLTARRDDRLTWDAIVRPFCGFGAASPRGDEETK